MVRMTWQDWKKIMAEPPDQADETRRHCGHKQLEVRPTGGRGRGVFARVAFPAGEIIESCPVILIPAEQWHNIEPTVLALYIYNFGPDGEHAAIALGFGSLYNHSFSPNAEYLKSWDEQLIRIRAIQEIQPGEEITVNYNGSPEDQSPMWFELQE